MRTDPHKLLMGFYFYPRGGSAHACEAIARELVENGFDVTLLAGRAPTTATWGRAEEFFSDAGDSHRRLHAGAGEPRIRSASTATPAPPRCTAPTRTGRDAEDPVFATLDDETFERPGRGVDPRAGRAGRGRADLLYLHHLTPLNEAARAVSRTSR